MISVEVLRTSEKKNVLITGGTGMIGREIVNMLCDAGANVRIVSLDEISVHEKADHVVGDLTDSNLCKEITRDID